jgi:hypothetical protein
VTPPKGVCVECGSFVSRVQSAVFEVHGYSSDRGPHSGGGMNHLRDVKRVDGRIWHEHCWETYMRRQRHDGGEQGTLG